jgi:hypothetical protein
MEKEMSKKQNTLILVLALIAGLVGGVVSSWFLMGQPVFAERIPRVIKAHAFQVVDEKGQRIIQLGGEWQKLQFFDARGRSRTYYDGSGFAFYNAVGSKIAYLLMVPDSPELRMRNPQSGKVVTITPTDEPIRLID